MTGAPTIGLALSGGGFRATAFGLGCLRALHDRDLLRQVRIVSGISGGGLLAAMWAYGPADFAEFDLTVTDLLRRGLHRELLRRAATPTHLLKTVASAGRSIPGLRGHRSYSRTDLLADALAALPFGAKHLTDVTHHNLHTVISATDLSTTNAVRFGSAVSSCSAYGDITTPIRVADAVAASAAFPILLPALPRTYEFSDRHGARQIRTVTLSDGGVYDNLGLSPLLPGRSSEFTSHVYNTDYIVAVDAGRGRVTKQTTALLPFRLARSFDITFNKTQDGSRAQLNSAAASGHLRGFVHAYLAMHDEKLSAPINDFVTRGDVASYPTNFGAVTPPKFQLLTVRGEQLTRTLLTHYCPDLI